MPPASLPGHQSSLVLLPTSQYLSSKELKPTSSMHNTMSPASSSGHQSPSALLPASPHLRSKESKPRHEKFIYPEREWVWIWAPWISIIFVSFIFAKAPTIGAYYRHEFYVNGSALSRRWAMALAKGLLYCVPNTPYFFWENVGSWITESWKNRPEFSRHSTDRLPDSYAWMLTIVARVTSSVIVILACLNRLLHPTEQFAIAGWTLMWRFIQTCINKLKLPVIWVRLRLGNLLLTPITCWKYLTWPMQAFPSEWWRRMWSYKKVELDRKLRIEKPVVQDTRPQSSLRIFSWPKQQHLVNDWWRSVRQSRKARLGWKPCIGNLKVQNIRVQSGLRILGSILLGVILIFLIWDIQETLSSPKYDDWFWAFLNARIQPQSCPFVSNRHSVGGFFQQSLRWWSLQLGV